jgi:hypothetical protein
MKPMDPECEITVGRCSEDLRGPAGPFSNRCPRNAFLGPSVTPTARAINWATCGRSSYAASYRGERRRRN